MLLASWTFDTVEKKIRSLNTENLGSVGQSAAKLLAIKLWEWFDFARVRTRADWFNTGQGKVADILLRPPTLKASNFAALWPTDPIFTALKNQEASCVFRINLVSQSDLISLHKRAKQRFHMNVAVFQIFFRAYLHIF